MKVLITGAASGIGFEIAKLFAKDNCTLIMTDINNATLEASAGKLRKYGADIYTETMDVGDKDEVAALAEWIDQEFGSVDVLINNAGIGYAAELIDTDMRTWEELMKVNFWAPLYHVNAILPLMISARGGHIVNVSSGQAFFRLPTWGAYAVTKLAAGAYSEILKFELKKFNIKVTTVYPFMVDTGFYKEEKLKENISFGRKISMKLLPYYSMTPQKVGKIIYKAIKNEKAVENVSFINTIGRLTRLVPTVSNIISTGAMAILGKEK